jgi:MFS family permease
MASSERLKQLFASFHSRNYRFYFMGQSLSLIGTWMQNVAMSWLVYRLTGSVFLLGVVGFANQIPSFFFSPVAGVISDQYNRRTIMIWAQVLFMVQALLLSILTLLGIIQVWHIISLSLLFGFIMVFDTPARHSLVVDLVTDRKDLGNAIALNSAMFNAARLIGPGIAGIVIAITGEGICFLLNAFSFVMIILALWKIKVQSIPKQPEHLNIIDNLKAGYHYTFGFAPIKFLILILAVISLMGMPFLVLLPAYAREILSGDSKTLGFLMSSAGLGSLLAALYLASRIGTNGLFRILIFATILFGTGIMALALSHQSWLAYSMMFLCGFGMIASIASINTLIQSTISDDMRGRVMSFYAVALMGMNPLGSFLAGSSASTIGIRYTLLIGGAVCVITGFIIALIRNKLKSWF